MKIGVALCTVYWQTNSGRDSRVNAGSRSNSCMLLRVVELLVAPIVCGRRAVVVVVVVVAVVVGVVESMLVVVAIGVCYYE